MDFRGTLLIVSHDRTFLNNVVTSTLVFEDGRVNEYVGGYDDWQAAVKRREDQAATPVVKEAKAKSPPRNGTTPPTSTATDHRKRSYKEKRELEQLPQQIEKLEGAIAESTRGDGRPLLLPASGRKDRS